MQSLRRCIAPGAVRALRSTSRVSPHPCILAATQHRLLSRSIPRRELASPLNLPKWLDENSHLLQPPINNYCVYDKDGATVMIVGGPNARTDYHINSTPEYFYQYKGPLLLKTVQQDPNSPDSSSKFKDIVVPEGSMFLLPPNIPHSPIRFANTVGIVLEQHRPKGALDKLRWYCQKCEAQVHEAAFECTDLGTQIKEAVLAFEKDEQARVCGNCGTMCEVRPAKPPTPPAT